MKNTVYRLDLDAIQSEARTAFFKSSGISGDSDKHRRMARMAEQTLQSGKSGLSPVAIVSAYDGSALNADRLTLDGVVFSCNAFARADPARVNKIFAYILTVGEVVTTGDNILEQIYADMWGTAFTDAALRALEDTLAGARKVMSFGPGCYGMEVTYLPRLFELLDARQIGVTISDPGCCMIPLKSCAGFILTADEHSALPPADCSGCVGNKGGCRLCKNNTDAKRKQYNTNF